VAASSASAYPRSGIQLAAAPEKTGRLSGSPLVGAADWIVRKYGPAASHELVLRLSARWPGVLAPHAPSLGLLGARRYEYAFVGDFLRMGALVTKTEEDAFIRATAIAGIEASMSTIARVVARYAATPERLAARAQETWSTFHDSGRVEVVLGPREYVATLRDWAGHDVAVCKNAMEVRRHLLAHGGLRNVVAIREKCQAWGHDVCVTRVQWD
jgi:hypothetical protein